MFEAFGVNPDAEFVYLQMLRHPEWSVGQIAAHLDTSPDTVKAAHHELVELSLLYPSWDDPAVLRPVSPELGLRILLARQQADLTRRQQEIEEGRAAVEALIAERSARPLVGNGSTGIEELLGVDAVREALERVAYEARHEVLTFTPDGAQSIAALSASRGPNQRLLGKGVAMRTIYLTSARNDAATAEHARWLERMGGRVRTVPILPIRMVVVDHQYAIVPIDPAQSSRGAYLLRVLGSVTAAIALFERYWRDATPWGAPTSRSDHAPNDQERALLQLLFDGCTDEQAARKLGVSPRTVGRMTADLMARLGARSRFQAGALAVHEQWIDVAAEDPSRSSAA